MSFSNGDVFYHVRLNNMVNASKDNGVLSGLEVTAQGTPSMTLDVAAGQCHVDNETYEETAATTVVIGTAHATLPRLDIVCYDTSGTAAAVTAGTAASTPQPPNIPSGDILLAVVSIPATDTTISNDQITDERIIVRPVGLIYSASDILIISDDSEESHNTASYVKVKEFDPIPDDMFSDGSTLRIKFDMKSSIAALVYGRIHRNGVLVSPVHSTGSTTYVTFSDNILGWSAGDLIQLYTNSFDVGRTVYIENFRVYGDFGFKSVYNW